MSQSARISYVIMAVLLLLIGWLHLGTLILTVLFGYFALQQFSFGRSKLLGVALYLIAVVAIGCGLFYFSRQAYVTAPKIAETTIPAVVEYAEKQGVELPFTDYASLKTVAINEVKEDVANVGRHVRAAAFQIVLLLVGLVVAAGLFLNATWGTENDPNTSRDSLYATVVRELDVRARTFYRSFSRVIGAQIIISIINTVVDCRVSDLERLSLQDGAGGVHVSVRVVAHHRQHHQQHAHRRRQLHPFAEHGARRADFSHRHSQAGIFPQQQNHR